MITTPSQQKLFATLSERFKAVNGTVLDLEVVKPYSSGLTTYYVYVTFEDCAGPLNRYRKGEELDHPFSAFRLIYKGRETLEEYTANPVFLALDCYHAKYQFLTTLYEADKKQSALYQAEKTFSRINTEYQVALIRGKCSTWTTMEKCYIEQQNAYSALYDAVVLYDNTLTRIDNQIGIRPFPIPDNYKMYRN